jgi:dipeptide/tripeptide permease
MLNFKRANAILLGIGMFLAGLSYCCLAFDSIRGRAPGKSLANFSGIAIISQYINYTERATH